MNWLTRLVPARIRTSGASKKVPEGLWAKCPECKAVLYRTELEHNLEVCPRCNHHLRIGARQRLNAFLDAEPRQEIGAELEAVDVHKFKDTKRYRDRLLATQKETAERDALVVMQGTLLGRPLVAAAFEFRFMGGSMGSVVGERFTRGAQVCLDRELPLVCFLLRRRAHAGRPVLPAADGQDLGHAGLHGRGRAAVHLGADRSDHRRRVGQSGHAGRRDHR